MPAWRAACGTAELHGAPLDEDLPPVGPVNAREDLPERALAGAVLAAQRVAGAGGDREADVLERQHAGKALADVLEGDGWESLGQGFVVSSSCQIPVGVQSAG